MATSGLGQLLVKEGLLTETDRILIRNASGTQGGAFARGVIAIGLLDEEELAAFLAEKTKWRIADKDLTRESRKDAWGAIDRLLVERLEVMPLRLEGDTLLVAMVDPLDRDTIEQLRFFTGCRIKPVIATLSQIRAGLTKLLSDYKPAKSHLEDFLENHALSASQKIRLKQLGNGHGAPLATLVSRGEKPRSKTPEDRANQSGNDVFSEKSQIDNTKGARIGSHAAQASSAPSKGSKGSKGSKAAQASSGDFEFDDLSLTNDQSEPAKPGNLSDSDDDLLGDFGSGPDAAVDDGLGGDLDGASAGRSTTAAPVGDSSGDILDDDLIFDTDEQDLSGAPSKGKASAAEAPGPDEDPSLTETSDPLQDDLLGGSEIADGGAQSVTDLSFVDGIPDETQTLDQDPDLDSHAVEAIADMDESLDDSLDQSPGHSVDELEHNPENRKPGSPSAAGDEAPVSDDDLFDIGALASDFNTIEDSIAQSGAPSAPSKPSPSTAKKAAAEAGPESAEITPSDDLLSDPPMLQEDDDTLLSEPTSMATTGAGGQTDSQERPEFIASDESLLDPLDEFGLNTEESSPNIPSLNRFMMTMSLMTDPKVAMDKAVPVLIEAGLTRGIVINLTGGSSQAILGWGISGEVIERDSSILARFDGPEGQKWLEAAPRELSVVDPQSLGGAMAHYAPWIAGGQRQILSLVAPSSDASRQVAYVTGWEHKGTIDLSLQNMVADIFRKIALYL